jgi:hypothetical protein
LSSQDLLAYLYVLFEEDSVITSPEHQESKHRFRHSFYENMLEWTYEWAPKPQDAGGAAVTYGGEVTDTGSDTSTEPILPELASGARVRMESKSYVPPTKFDPDASKPFGNLLDEPLG